MIQSIFLALLAFAVPSLAQVTGSGVQCECVWTSDYRNGAFPDEGVDFGSGDFVVRVLLNGNWIPGRLAPTDETAYAPAGSLRFPTYQVLTNPENCALTWVDAKSASNSLLNLGVSPENGENPTSYVARGQFDEFLVGGRITRDSMRGDFVHEDRIVTSDEMETFEILQSEYPALEATMTEFEFTPDYANLKLHSKEFLFGIEEMVNDINITIQQTVTHEQVVEEHFSFEEEYGLGWKGMRSVDAKVQLWCGSPLVTFKAELEKGQSKLSESRERTVTVVKEVTGADTGAVQICSWAVILQQTLPIRFNATANVVAENMNGDQVHRIVQKTGRACFERGENSCKIRVNGKLTGKYVIRVKSRSSEMNSEFPCADDSQMRDVSDQLRI